MKAFMSSATATRTACAPARCRTLEWARRRPGRVRPRASTRSTAVRDGDFKISCPTSPPFVLGNDLAGVVVRRRFGRHPVRGRREVYARPDKDRIGTFAELIAVHQDDLAIKPATLSMVEAASLPLVALTAWQALVERASTAGQKVLIHAGPVALAPSRSSWRSTWARTWPPPRARPTSTW